MKNNNWGPVTWALMHTIVCKVNPKYFKAYKHDLINLIKTICSSLPCEYCASHASRLLKNYNYSIIKTHKDFKRWLWEFHNIINIKLNKPEKDKNIINNYYNNNLLQLLAFWNTKFILKVTDPYLLKYSIKVRNTQIYVNNFINNNKFLFII